MFLKKSILLGLFVLFSALVSSTQIFAQVVRPRLAPESSQKANKVKKTVQQYQRNAPTNNLPIETLASRATVKTAVVSRPTANGAQSVLTNELFVRPTVSSVAANAGATKSAGAASASAMAAFRARILTAMNSKLGIPYRYGSQGPDTYDCSGLVWTVFGEAGINFERSSANTFWQKFEPVSDEDKHKFGTLVFFNELGHVGIVIDKDTFFHASNSKGVTFSKFEGYWEKRIVGFRRVPLNQFLSFPQ